MFPPFPQSHNNHRSDRFFAKSFLKQDKLDLLSETKPISATSGKVAKLTRQFLL